VLLPENQLVSRLGFSFGEAEKVQFQKRPATSPMSNTDSF
jgi:hypothetical protein